MGDDSILVWRLYFLTKSLGHVLFRENLSALDQPLTSRQWRLRPDRPYLYQRPMYFLLFLMGL